MARAKRYKAWCKKNHKDRKSFGLRSHRQQKIDNYISDYALSLLKKVKV